jgi:hypothetical protein
MKLSQKRASGVTGSVLFVTIISAGILGLLLGSYLTLVQTHSLSLQRSQCWNTALVIAEGGVEEGMAHVNSGVDINNLATNTWVSLGSGIVGKTNFLGSNYAVISIQTQPAVTNISPVITATGYVPGPSSGKTLARTLQVNTRTKVSGIGGAIIMKGSINFSGTKVTVDSFDSSNTNYSTGGLYDPAKREDHGDITCLSTVSNAVQILESQVYGIVHTEPGVQPIVDASKNGTGSVGDLNWVNNNTKGIESGHAFQDANASISDVTLPNLAWIQPTKLQGQNALKTNGVTFAYVLNNFNPWQITDLSSSIYVTQPNVVLYVSSTLSLGSGTEIYIAPGASLTMYVGAASASLGGQGIVNSSGVASAFTYNGLPSNTSLGIQANASFTGKIYAPEADITLGGGGSSPYDFSGQIVGSTFKLNGHYSVHYDENVGGPGTASGYAAISWNEL